MSSRRLVASISALGLVAVLGVFKFTNVSEGDGFLGRAVGGEGELGCADGAMLEVDPESILEAAGTSLQNIPEDLARTAGPEDADEDRLNDNALPGRFVVRFNSERELTVDGDRVITGNPELDKRLEELEVVSPRLRFQKLKRDTPIGRHLNLKNSLEIETNRPPTEVIDRLTELEDIDWVEPVVEIQHFASVNDPYFGYQWHMQAMGLESVLDITDASGVVVAVVDSGVSAGSDSYLDLVQGYDFFSDDSDASDSDYNRGGSGSHGTHVAGTIAQQTNNRVGVAGLAPGASIMPVRVLGYSAMSGGITGSSTDVAEGITWAVDNGADVINLSLGSSSYSQVIADACSYAYDQGVVVIAASGNDGYTNFISYPAALSTVMAIGATDLNHEVSYYSNQGEGLHLVAPGGDTTNDADGDGYVDGVLQETRSASGWNYYFFQGTSMAAPHAAALAALIKAQGVDDVSDVWDIMIDTADDLGAPGWDSSTGYGLINPMAALEEIAGGGSGEGGGDDADPDDEADIEGPAGLEILDIETTRMAPRRAMLSFQTSEPASAVVRSGIGRPRINLDYVSSHQYVIMGRAGNTSEVTVTLETEGGETLTETLSVEF